MSGVIHLDSAAAGRSSGATRAAVTAHLDQEALLGAYVAEMEAAPVISAARANIAALLGMTADGVAFVESATVALATLLGAWPVERGDVVAVVPGEWGPNLAAFADAGLRTVLLDVDAAGVLDLDALPERLAAERPAFVHLTHVASHRALVQPVAAAAEVCRAAGIPLWVDAAQALGHVHTVSGADVAYATSRKWLAGPRGVGIVAVAERWWSALRIGTSANEPLAVPADWSPVRRLESHEANVAGRVGLAAAVQQHLDAGPAEIHALLLAVGRATREALSDVPGWRVVDDLDAPAAITAVAPTRGASVVDTRARLLHDHRIVTTAGQTYRAPLDMTEPYLRVSPHVDLRSDDLVTLRDALAG